MKLHNTHNEHCFDIFIVTPEMYIWFYVICKPVSIKQQKLTLRSYVIAVPAACKKHWRSVLKLNLLVRLSPDEQISLATTIT
jgi:hypothetical protein